MKILIYRLSFLLILITLLSSCRKREALAAADNFVVFENNAQGITASENTITVKLKLLSPTNVDVPVILNLIEQGVQYTTDYSTLPTATAGKINLVIPSGSNETSFKINKTAGAIFDGDEKLVFSIYSSGAPVFIGVTKEFTLSFAELVANNFTSTINGGGATFGNKVFIDISANRNVAVQRTNWDLGFYNGNDDYRVMLNSSVNMMAKQTTKTDINSVTIADTVGISGDIAFNLFAPTTTSLPYIDYPNGDLTRSAISAISANPIDNKVYILNQGNAIGVNAMARGWKKLRILRNTSGGYTLQFAEINATTFTSVEISKDDRTFFKNFSIANGMVDVEPAKKKWDFAWTYFANTTNFGGGEVPYLFQDVILINRNVQVAKVLTATKTFENFAESDIPSLTFLSTQNAIATDWRNGGGPTTQPSVRTDRYYIIKDADNNIYKIRFTALTQNNERGYPSYEAILVKKG